jgi:hypothetical protein
VPDLLVEVDRLRAHVRDLQDDVDAYRLVADEIGKLMRDGWNDDAAEVAIIIDWAQHMDRMHPGCPGRWCGHDDEDGARAGETA